MLAILGLVVAVMMPPRSGAQQALELRAAARSVADGLARARDRAVTTGQPSVLAIDVDRRRFEASGDRNPTALPETARITLKTVTGAVADAGTGAIRFFPDGGSTGGGVVLADGNWSWRIGVDWLTGRVEVQDDR